MDIRDKLEAECHAHSIKFTTLIDELEFDLDWESDDTHDQFIDQIERYFGELGCRYIHELGDDPESELQEPGDYVVHMGDGDDHVPDTYYFSNPKHRDQFVADVGVDPFVELTEYLSQYPHITSNDWEPGQNNPIKKLGEFLKTYEDRLRFLPLHDTTVATVKESDQPTVIYAESRFGYINEAYFINSSDLAALFKLTFG